MYVCIYTFECLCLEVANFIWTFECVWLEAPRFIWLFTFGSAKLHMNFLDRTCPISFQSAKFHMNFLPCLEVSNFIWISLLGSSQIHMNIWNSLLERIEFHISYDFPCLEVPNFRWTNEIANFIVQVPWLEVPWSAKFHLKFPWISHDWNCQALYVFFSLKVPNFIWTYETHWLEVQKSQKLMQWFTNHQFCPWDCCLDSLIQGAKIKQESKILQPLEDAGVYIYISPETYPMENPRFELDHQITFRIVRRKPSSRRIVPWCPTCLFTPSIRSH